MLQAFQTAKSASSIGDSLPPGSAAAPRAETPTPAGPPAADPTRTRTAAPPADVTSS
ncbi:hypothetical protein H6G91_11560 [Nostoc muscorum FACHB-395]|uniref:hypothetical protein n=1 Tax=Nostoc sp. C057 TaxID=2576903 RepID=UPI0015C3AA0E|nr:hypothetical protein [Nostoc sp. C057]MBD2507906.1 hypothetical protein [Desmonostoc muscorum FACHB-395]